MVHKDFLKAYRAIKTLAYLSNDRSMYIRWLGRHTVEQIQELSDLIDKSKQDKLSEE